MPKTHQHVAAGARREVIVVIVGPTSSGKSALAVRLAKKFNGEVVSADSRQVYRGLNLGTGKVTKKEMGLVPHHLLDVASPRKQFAVVQYRRLALKAIKKILQKGKLPIICGGSGFYVQALVDRPVIPEVKPDWQLRKRLEKKSVKELYQLLKKLDRRRAQKIDRNNPRRLIRALEICLITKKPVPSFKTQPLPYPTLFLGIKTNWPILKKKIRQRLRLRIKKGLIVEVRKLRKSGLSWQKLENFGLEYRWSAKFLQQKISGPEMVFRLTKDIEHYAQRQLTWFKKDQRIHWVKNYREAEALTSAMISGPKLVPMRSAPYSRIIKKAA
jgi:tRNA dimethylallyltransferase